MYITDEEKVHIVAVEKAKRIKKIGDFLINAFLVFLGLVVLSLFVVLGVASFSSGFWYGMLYLGILAGILGLFVFAEKATEASETLRKAARYGTKDD